MPVSSIIVPPIFYSLNGESVRATRLYRGRSLLNRVVDSAQGGCETKKGEGKSERPNYITRQTEVLPASSKVVSPIFSFFEQRIRPRSSACRAAGESSYG